MEPAEVAEKVKQLLAEKLDIDVNTIRDDSKLVEDLGLDSFDTIELVFDLEEKVGISIPDTELKNIKTVRHIVDYIVTHSPPKS